jgi:hypothetical protein
VSDKTWGAEPFWGLDSDWDPDWTLTERQRKLRQELIDLCEQELRANARVPRPQASVVDHVSRLRLGAIDIAKRHTTRKRHVDVGLRVADYPTIQDYVGEAIIDTNASRLVVLSVAQAIDQVTENNTVTLRPGRTARAQFLHWAWQAKFTAAKNVARVTDKMLHACGGSGYKRDMELERYLRVSRTTSTSGAKSDA